MNSSFNGKRLKEARVYNKMSITDLANKLNVTKQMISKYENDKSSPTSEKSFILHDVLNYPREFFYTKENYEYKSLGTFFRSRLTATKKSKEPAEYLLKYSLLIRAFLEEYVEFPEVMDFNYFDEYSNPELAAEKLRELLGLSDGPIDDMLELLEIMGIVVVKFGYDEEKIDAFSCSTILNDKNYFAVVAGNTRSFYRQQFSLAHELGHFILHRDYNPQELEKDEYKIMEKEANDFAAAFLLPSSLFKEDLTSIDINLNSLLNLKKKWNVSIAAIIERGYQLKLINSSKRISLYRAMNYHQWKNPEPLDLETPVTEPLAISQAIELLIDEKVMTGFEVRKKIMNTFNLYITQSMMAEVCNVEEYIFSHQSKLSLNVKIKPFYRSEEK